MINEFFWEIALGIGLPLSGLVVYLIKHFWNKGICFKMMKAKLDRLDQEAEASDKVHTVILSRMSHLEGKMDIIIAKL